MAFNFEILVSTHDDVAQIFQCSRTGHKAMKAMKAFSVNEVVVKIGVLSVHEIKNRYTVQVGGLSDHRYLSDIRLCVVCVACLCYLSVLSVCAVWPSVWPSGRLSMRPGVRLPARLAC